MAQIHEVDEKEDAEDEAEDEEDDEEDDEDEEDQEDCVAGNNCLRPNGTCGIFTYIHIYLLKKFSTTYSGYN